MRDVNLVKDIEINNVSKSFGELKAVNDLSLSIEKGTIFCLVGPNAAGKTTTISLLLGILKPDDGNIKVKNFSIPKEKKKLRKIMGYLPQKRALYDLLSCRENIEFFAKSKGMSNEQAAKNTEFLLSKLSLNEHENKLAMHLSGGTQQRTALAAAMVNEPEIAFLDEPTVGLDPVLRKEFWEYFREVSTKRGTTILVTTHYLNEAEWADKVGVMREGKIMAIDTPQNLLEKTVTKNMESMFFKLLKGGYS